MTASAPMLQMNPPNIRDARHQAALWAAVRDGTVDVLGSDHAPHLRAEKDAGYPATPFRAARGADHGAADARPCGPRAACTIERVVDLLAAGPARIFGIAGKGRIAIGYDADLTLVDLKRRHTISNAEQASRCGWTPFDGMAVTGWPVATLIRGRHGDARWRRPDRDRRRRAAALRRMPARLSPPGGAEARQGAGAATAAYSLADFTHMPEVRTRRVEARAGGRAHLGQAHLEHAAEAAMRTAARPCRRASRRGLREM